MTPDEFAAIEARVRDQRDWLFDVVGMLIHNIVSGKQEPPWVGRYMPLYRHWVSAMEEMRLDDDDDGPCAATRRYLDQLDPPWHIDDEELVSGSTPICDDPPMRDGVLLIMGNGDKDRDTG